MIAELEIIMDKRNDGKGESALHVYKRSNPLTV